MKFSLFHIAQSTQYLWHQQALCLCADDLGHPDWILTFSRSFELNLFRVAALHRVVLSQFVWLGRATPLAISWPLLL